MLDHKEFADNILNQCSVYAFDRLPDGTLSDIRLMSINPVFEKVAHMNNPDICEFRPGMPYGDYAFKDPNFEKGCYECGITHDAHYEYINAGGFWISAIYIPLRSDRDNTYYVGYILKLNKEADSAEMTNESPDIMAAVLNTSIKLQRTNDFYKALQDTVQDICDICDTKKCMIVTADKENQSCCMISNNGADNQYLAKISESMGRTPFETVLAWEKDIGNTDCIIIKDEKDMEDLKKIDPIWYDSLQNFKIKSMALFSLRFHEELYGFLWCANIDTQKMSKLKRILGMISFFIGSVIANHQLVSRLRVLSMVDTLTGVYNRNAMNFRIDKYYDEKLPLPVSMAVVVADINGLKRVNDNEGHEAGDRLIQMAAALLKTAFSGYDVYRSGGDEFMVLCSDITRKKLKSCISNLKKFAANTSNVRMAVGTSYKTGNYDLREAMHEADEKMYGDKNEYYRSHPELERG